MKPSPTSPPSNSAKDIAITNRNIIITKRGITITHLLILTLVLSLSFTSVSAATRILHVNETDFVKLIPKAIDPDNDKITYTYTPPLDEKGEWQTTYNDSGEYNINITASDGILNTSEPVQLIVENKNQAPTIIENKIIVKETQEIDLKLTVDDQDHDLLTYNFPKPFDKNGRYTTTFNDSGIKIIEFNVSDGEYTTLGRVELQIENTNQAPFITDLFNTNSTITINEGQDLKYSVNINDENQEKLTILWTWDNSSISDKKNGIYHLTFNNSGTHNLTISASDGLETTTHSWIVSVQNTNRPPRIIHSPITADEGDKISFDLPANDEDGEITSYTYSKPFTSTGEWQTEYDSAGVYNITITATDGELTTTASIPVTVQDIDRAPQLILPQGLSVNEAETLTWKIDTTDPDGDNISINLTNLPTGAQFNSINKTLRWTPSYDELHRRGGILSNILNTLRLERFIIRSKTIAINVESCGKRWCTSGIVPIKVNNVNRAPILLNVTDITLQETQTITLNEHAIDPDGDIIHYYYTSPLEKHKWTPTINDQGIYPVYVTASDGKLQDTKLINIKVTKKDQVPTITLPGDDFTILEGQPISFKVQGTDPDNDNITLRIEDLPPEASFREGLFSWTPSFDIVENKTDNARNNLASLSNITTRRFSTEKSIYNMRFAASDGETEVIHPVKITVKNKNRIPTIESTKISTTTAKLGEPVQFEIDATDPDNDKLEYIWKTSWREPRIHQTTTLERIFNSPGEKTVDVDISDGRDTISYTWHITVTNELYNPPVPPVPSYKVFVIEHR